MIYATRHRRSTLRTRPTVPAAAIQTPAPALDAPLTIAEAIELHQHSLESLGRSESLIKNYAYARERLLAFLEDRGVHNPTINDLTPRVLREFTVFLRGYVSVNNRTGRTLHLGPKAVRMQVQGIKALTHFLRDEGIIDLDPIIGVKLPSAPDTIVRPFTADELKKMLEVIDGKKYAVRNRAIFYFLLATGVRASELCNLTIENLDLDAGIARIIGKGSKARVIQFDSLTAQYLRDYLAIRKSVLDSPIVFMNIHRYPLNRQAILRCVRDWGEAAGIDHAHPHRFRHSFATTWLTAHPGALFHLQVLLGHTNLEMTHRYARVVKGQEFLAGPCVVNFLGLGPAERAS